jgi:hypothetical protein
MRKQFQVKWWKYLKDEALDRMNAKKKYGEKGIVLPEMQNAFDNINGNRWYGFDRQDGNTLLIPRFATVNKFNVFLYNYYTDTMEKIISKSDMIIPGRYQAGEVTTVEKIYTIELRDGTLLLMFSGNKAGIDYKDIWRYI